MGARGAPTLLKLSCGQCFHTPMYLGTYLQLPHFLLHVELHDNSDPIAYNRETKCNQTAVQIAAYIRSSYAGCLNRC
jgi:hypothetical protein